MNGSARNVQKQALIKRDLTTSGRESSPLADFSAEKGKIVNASVAERNPAISEKRVAI